MKLAFVASRAGAAAQSLDILTGRYGTHSMEEADIVVALGGDGFMLDVIPCATRAGKPVYGMNRGTVGFLMNAFGEDDLEARLAAALEQVIHPLVVDATTRDGKTLRLNAINEVSVLRQGPQAANLRLSVDGRERLESLSGDGVLLATPAGSTAYNYSAFGPILPIGANVLALTPIAAFRPRRWRGAVLPDTARLGITNIDPDKRPVLLSADSASIEGVVQAEIALDRSIAHRLLFDPDHGLEERILNEQFV